MENICRGRGLSLKEKVFNFLNGPLFRHPQVSYGASSFYLSDKEKYPLFFRTVPPEEGHNYGRVAVLKYFKWDRIAIVTEREPYYEAVSKTILLAFEV